VLQKQHNHNFTQQDIDLFERVVDRLAIAIERSLLREQAQQTMQEAAQHLKYVEQMNQTLQRFVSIMGHEFRTTLTTILGFSELLLSPYTTPGEVQEYAKDILPDAQRLLHLVDDLLNLDRMQQGKMKLSLRKEQVDIVTLLYEQIERTRQIAHVHTFSLFHHHR
jgi:signal transduction histidine kinase